MPGIETRPLKSGGQIVGTRYVVRVRDPHPKVGRSGYTSATFATEPEAKQFVRDVGDRGVGWALEEYRRAKDEATEPTLDQWAEIHFASLTKPSAGTVARYRRIYRAVWHPELGGMRLSKIERVHVAQALNKVTGSDKTVLNAWGVLTHMLKMAAQDNLIVRSPTIGVSPGRRTEHEREEHRYLTRAEFWAVLDATPVHWQPLVMLLGGTGMRWGEAAALTVGDVDLDGMLTDVDGTMEPNPSVSVTKAEKQDPDHPSRTIVGVTKSRRARRVIPIDADVAEMLAPLVDGRRRTERLFLPPKGGPLRHRTFYRDIWLRKSLPGSGISQPYPRLHDLRHSHVAWLIAANTSLPVIQARLGHEKITTTVDTYGHLLPGAQRAAVDAARRALGPRPPSRAELSPAGSASMPGR